MDESKYQEIIAMLTVIYKKLDKLENKAKGGTNMPTSQSCLNELRREALKIINQISIQ